MSDKHAMNAKPANTWQIPAAALLIAIGCVVWIFCLPAGYQDHHEWPGLLAIIAFVLGLYSIGNLFWLTMPLAKLPQALLALGFLLLLLTSAAHSWLGLLLAVLVILTGAALMILRRVRS